MVVSSDCVNPKFLLTGDYDLGSAETEITLDELLTDKTIENLESSSNEDMMYLCASRPCSSSGKSVSFSDFIDVEIISPQIKRRISSSSPSNVFVKPILKKEDQSKEMMRKTRDCARDRLYKDLRMLVEVRDRIAHAIQQCTEFATNFSPRSGCYQTIYLEKLRQNKETLDGKIEQVWEKLTEIPLEEHQAKFVDSVMKSEELTLNSRKKEISRIYTSYFEVSNKQNKYDNLELASDYAVKLQHMRGNFVRRDSEIRRSDQQSVQDIISRVSRALQSYDNKN